MKNTRLLTRKTKMEWVKLRKEMTKTENPMINKTMG